MNEIRTTIRVFKIQKIKTQTKNTDKQLYVLTGKDRDGVGSIQVKLPVDFDGFAPESVIDVTISSSQMSLTEFAPPKLKGRKKK